MSAIAAIRTLCSAMLQGCKRIPNVQRSLILRQVNARDRNALSVIVWVEVEPMEDRECDKFYRASMLVLEKANVPFLVGGAYAFGVYSGIVRDTKDFDLFVEPKDVEHAIAVLQAAGYDGERTFPHWLAKAKFGDDVVDFIYRAGNGLCEVDSTWFSRARDGELLGLSVKLCAPEEIL